MAQRYDSDVIRRLASAALCLVITATVTGCVQIPNPSVQGRQSQADEIEAIVGSLPGVEGAEFLYNARLSGSEHLAGAITVTPDVTADELVGILKRFKSAVQDRGLTEVIRRFDIEQADRFESLIVLASRFPDDEQVRPLVTALTWAEQFGDAEIWVAGEEAPDELRAAEALAYEGATMLDLNVHLSSDSFPADSQLVLTALANDKPDWSASVAEVTLLQKPASAVSACEWILHLESVAIDEDMAHKINDLVSDEGVLKPFCANARLEKGAFTVMSAEWGRDTGSYRAGEQMRLDSMVLEFVRAGLNATADR